MPAALLAPVTNVNLTARLDRRRVELSGTLANDAFTLAPRGIVDFSDNSFGRLKLPFRLLRPAVLGANLSGAGLRGLFVLDGAFAVPHVTYALNADRLFIDGMGVERLTASGDARVDAGRIVIPVAARVERIAGLDTVAGGSLANVRLDGDLAVEGTRLLSDNMRLRSDRIDADLVIAADTRTGFYAGTIDGRIDDYRVDSVAILMSARTFP